MYRITTARVAPSAAPATERYSKSTVDSRDTSSKALKVYFRRLAGMTPSERLNLGVALWEAGDSLQRAASRRNNPDAGEAEIAFRIAVTRFASELARKAYRRP